MLFAWYFLLSLFFRAFTLLVWPLSWLGWDEPVVEAAFQIVIYDELTTCAWDARHRPASPRDS